MTYCLRKVKTKKKISYKLLFYSILFIFTRLDNDWKFNMRQVTQMYAK